MFINIQSYSHHLEDLFNQGTQVTVHSVFNNTCNIKVKDRLFTLQRFSLPKTPMSISLNLGEMALSELRVAVGESIYFNPEGLLIHGQLLSKKRANVYDYKVVPYRKNKETLISLTETIADALHSSMCHGEFVKAMRNTSLDQKTLRPLGQYAMETFVQLNQSENKHQFVKTVVQIIGVGEGLTPSGDDFVCGMLAAFHYLNDDKEINKLLNLLMTKLSLVLDTTTSISREYLMYAMMGEFNEYVVGLLHAYNHDQQYQEYLEKISSIGHSSGSDFLVGLYYGLLEGGKSK